MVLTGLRAPRHDFAENLTWQQRAAKLWVDMPPTLTQASSEVRKRCAFGSWVNLDGK